jgi:hypothetical protein
MTFSNDKKFKIIDFDSNSVPLKGLNSNLETITRLTDSIFVYDGTVNFLGFTMPTRMTILLCEPDICVFYSPLGDDNVFEFLKDFM